MPLLAPARFPNPSHASINPSVHPFGTHSGPATLLHLPAERLSHADEEAGPRSPLLSAQTSISRSLSVTMSSEQREKEFLEALDSELAKIIRFYLKKEAEITAQIQELSMQVQHAEGIQPEQAAGVCSCVTNLVIW